MDRILGPWGHSLFMDNFFIESSTNSLTVFQSCSRFVAAAQEVFHLFSSENFLPFHQQFPTFFAVVDKEIEDLWIHFKGHKEKA